MSLVPWMQPFEDYLELDYLATNRNPKVVDYFQENPKMIDWTYIWSNEHAMELLKKNMTKIDWKQICLNPHPDAIHLIKTHHEYYVDQWNTKRRRIPYDQMLSWSNLSQNSSAFEFIKQYPQNDLWFIQKPPYDPHEDDYDYAGNPYFDNLRPDHEINWSHISQYASDNTFDLLIENPRNIDWSYLSSNTSNRAIELLMEYPENIDWYWASQNPSAMDLIEANLDIVDWRQLCKNPNAVHLFLERRTEIDWSYLSANPSAIWLLELYRKQIDWRWLCKNPQAGQLLKENCEIEYDKFDFRWLSENPCIFE